MNLILTGLINSWLVVANQLRMYGSVVGHFLPPNRAFQLILSKFFLPHDFFFVIYICFCFCFYVDIFSFWFFSIWKVSVIDTSVLIFYFRSYWWCSWWYSLLWKLIINWQLISHRSFMWKISLEKKIQKNTHQSHTYTKSLHGSTICLLSRGVIWSSSLLLKNIEYNGTSLNYSSLIS